MESSTKLLTLKEQAVSQLQSSIDPDSEVNLMAHFLAIMFLSQHSLMVKHYLTTTYLKWTVFWTGTVA